MSSLRLLTYQLGSGNTTCYLHYFCECQNMNFSETGHPLMIVEFKCITFHSMHQLNMSYWISLFLSPDHTVPVLSTTLEIGTRLWSDSFFFSEKSSCGRVSYKICPVQHFTPHRGRWGNPHEYTGGRASRCPVESDFSESSSTWTFSCRFLSPPSLHRIHGRGHRPRRNTKNSAW